MNPTSSSPVNEDLNPTSSRNVTPPPLAVSRIFGVGEMAVQTRSFRWETTPLGPIPQWPEALLYSVNNMLASGFPTVVFWGPHLTVLYNDAYMPLAAEKHPRLLGHTAAQAWAEAWHIIGPQFDAVLNEGETVHQKEQLVPVYREGVLHQVYWTYSYSPIRNLEGTIHGILIVCHDVTKNLEVQREKDQNEAQLAAFVDLIPTLAWMADKDGWIFWYNQRWYEYTGTQPEQMEGWGWQSVHDPAMLSSVLERWNQSIRTGEPFEMVFPLRGADGVFRSFITRVIPSKDPAGNVIRWFGTNTEIDEFQRTRESLRRSREDLDIGMEAADLGMWCYDSHTGVVTADARMHRILGSPEPAGVVGDWLDFVYPEDRERVEEHFAGFLAGDHDYDIEYRIVRKGEVRWLFSRGKAVGPKGKAERLVAILEDITERKKAEAALKQNEKLAAVGRLAASIAHEINNPLECVTNLLYLMQSARDLDEAQSYLQTAELELRRVSLITSQTLRFHRQTTKASPVLLSNLIGDVLALFHGRIINNKIEVEKRNRAEHLVPCLEGEIRQVISNLIGNAIDVMPTGGRLLVRSREAQSHRTGKRGMVVTVADTGFGMSAEVQRKAFDAFYSTKGVGGTGLGLWISNEIVMRHRGELRFRSRCTPRSSGTVFTLYLPFYLEGDLPLPL